MTTHRSTLSQPKLPSTMWREADWHTEFWKQLAPIDHLGYSQHETLRIFLDMAFRALRGPTLAHGSKEHVENERLYAQAFNRTTKPDVTREAAGRTLGVVVMALEALGRIDFLGPLMMQAGGNKDAGQFFTPASVTAAIAQLISSEPLPDTPTVSVLEPAAGSGGMLLSFANEADKHGTDRLRLRCEAWDVDVKCAQATFIQMTLCAIPCVVVHGNTLTQERWGTWPTIGMSPWFRAAALAHALVGQEPSGPPSTKSKPKRVRVVLERTSPDDK